MFYQRHHHLLNCQVCCPVVVFSPPLQGTCVMQRGGLATQLVFHVRSATTPHAPNPVARCAASPPPPKRYALCQSLPPLWVLSFSWQKGGRYMTALFGHLAARSQMDCFCKHKHLPQNDNLLPSTCSTCVCVCWALPPYSPPPGWVGWVCNPDGFISDCGEAGDCTGGPIRERCSIARSSLGMRLLICPKASS